MASKLFAVTCFSIAILAIADVFWTRYNWKRKLMMTQQELKDEHKHVEGDPLIKIRQQSLARGRQRDRMMTAVPEATLIVANPTHFSVALKYDSEVDPAPTVVAKGQDILALRIRVLAAEHDIPVFENKPLAQGLHASVEVGQIIPPEFYKPVAELISYISRIR